MDYLDTYYQDFDNANSPVSSEDDGNVDGERGKFFFLKKRRITFCRFNEIVSMEGFDLEVGMLFRDKKQLTNAIDNYRIYKGYALKATISDKRRFRAVCCAKGCEWKLWASKPLRNFAHQENVET